MARLFCSQQISLFQSTKTQDPKKSRSLIKGVELRQGNSIVRYCLLPKRLGELGREGGEGDSEP